MARIRSVKPDFFTDADLCELSPLHRLLFQALWCQADRDGRLEDKPRELKVKCLPFDDCNVDAMLADLHDRGFIVRYEALGTRYIAIPKFAEHQKFHRDERPIGLPPPPENHQRSAPQPQHAVSLPEKKVAPPASSGCQRKAAPDIGHLTSDIGRLTTEPPPDGAVAGSPTSLADAVGEVFQRIRHTRYRGHAKDYEGAKRLAGEGAAEVAKRFERALTSTARFPSIATLYELSQHWDHFATDAKAPGKPQDARKGYAYADDQDWKDGGGFADLNKPGGAS